jgi:sulfoxide reductase heme-binding subunit YedZ
VLKRSTVMAVVKLGVCALSVIPAVMMVRAFGTMNRHYIRAYDYGVLSFGIAETGKWAFIFLLVTLACTPLQRLTGLRFPAELRRTLGLLSFLYCLLHFVVYILIGQKLHWDYAFIDALNQKSRIPGWFALILLVPLVLTSTDGMIRRVGAKRWKNLHRLVYLATALAIAHLAWTESDRHTDYRYTKNVAVPFVILMALRFVPRRKSKPRTA